MIRLEKMWISVVYNWRWVDIYWCHKLMDIWLRPFLALYVALPHSIYPCSYEASRQFYPVLLTDIFHTLFSVFSHWRGSFPSKPLLGIDIHKSRVHHLPTASSTIKTYLKWPKFQELPGALLSLFHLVLQLSSWGPLLPFSVEYQHRLPESFHRMKVRTFPYSPYCCEYRQVHARIAEAVDRWFQNLEKYEVTLVRITHLNAHDIFWPFLPTSA